MEKPPPPPPPPTASRASKVSIPTVAFTSSFLINKPTDIFKIIKPEIEEDETWHGYIIPLLAIFAILTTFGNGVIVYSILSNKALRTSTNFCLVSLALADMLVGAVVMPLATSQEVNFQISIEKVNCSKIHSGTKISGLLELSIAMFIKHVTLWLALAQSLVFVLSVTTGKIK